MNPRDHDQQDQTTNPSSDESQWDAVSTSDPAV